ncbi:hypothetical protein Godav_025646 [Gossypium davidsonii]|uniref:Uncharacterized protein n=4 Tax=Gossypium TaxID=3633 RepID=A0A7J8TJY5_GOSDV|nr:hypothetical protein [Gossypium davidsonii]
MKRLAVGSMTTSEYNEWLVRRINDNIPKPSQGSSQSIKKHLRVVSSELEIIREDFERRNVELEKKIEQMGEEKMNLRLDVDVQKLEVEKLRKRKNKAEEDLDSLKIDYKKLCLLMRTTGLGKTSEKLQEVQTRNEALEKSLSENQKEKGELKDRVAKLERSLRQYQNWNSAIELRVSLSRIDELKKRIEELETALQNCEIQIKYLEANEDHNNEQLHYFQNQVRNRDHIMGEAVVQI